SHVMVRAADMLSCSLMRRAALLLVATEGLLAVAGSRWAAAENLRITGRVTFDGRAVPRDRRVRVQISRDFPGFGQVPAEHVPRVGPRGQFTFDGLPAGEWWLAAYIDDPHDGAESPASCITGYSTIHPVTIGDGRNRFAATIDLDPILVVLVTRFEPASGL